MKAVVYTKYGTPDVLELKEVDKPVPDLNEVLIKVYATSVTAADWRMRKADPFLVRLFNGLLKPRKVKILGFELAGIIEEVGSNVTDYKTGDPVFASCGFKGGGYGEYICLKADDAVSIKPSNMTFRQAATVPLGGLTALRFLNMAGIKQGQKVLIYGASGSVGTFAVQIAKAFDTEVTAVCSTRNMKLVQSLMADKVIDYTREDITKFKPEFDMVFDAVGKVSGSSLKKLLKPGGKYVSVRSTPKKGTNELMFLKQLIEAGKLNTVIDKHYTLDQIGEAHLYVEQFRKAGNVSICVLNGNNYSLTQTSIA